MKTFFASPEKMEKENLAAEIDFASKNPVISGLLRSISGILAVLDENRQIIALNDESIKMLGIDNPAEALGLRPGEALRCIHADDGPAGCGTTKFCSTCGTATAIVSSLKDNEPVERICTLTARNKDGSTVDTVLLIRAQPILLEGKRFILLFFQDITQQQKKAALERTFFHDINNMLGILSGASELLARDDSSVLAQTVYKTTQRLIKEVAIQRYLLQSGSFAYQPIWDDFSVEQILDELRFFFVKHPTAQKKHIYFPKDPPELSITTDISLLLRVLCNIIINVLEASESDTPVKISIEQSNESLSFSVWNAQEISKEAAERIFQLNCSTKAEIGRGVGTYSMKLLGEKILGGQVQFTTSAEQGTIFKCTIPLRQP